MKATIEAYKEAMQSLTNEQIKNLILCTFEHEDGPLISQAGYIIIEERDGKDESDRIYEEVWDIAALARRVISR